MSGGTSSLSVVGIKYSAAGLLELMWKPEPTWNRSSTVVALPRMAVAAGAGDTVTDGVFLPSESCAASGAADSKRRKAGLRMWFTIDLVAGIVSSWVQPKRLSRRLRWHSRNQKARSNKPRSRIISKAADRSVRATRLFLGHPALAEDFLDVVLDLSPSF